MTQYFKNIPFTGNNELDREIKICFEKYFSAIDKKIKEDTIDLPPFEVAQNMMAITNNLDNLIDYDYWMDKLFYLVKHCKTIFENNLLDSVGFFNGYSEIEYALWLAKNKTGYFSNFHDYINEIVLNLENSYLDYCKTIIDELTMMHYDVVSGLSGIGYNLLKKDSLNNKERNLASNISKYFFELCKDYTYKNHNIIKFHIKQKNQYREDEKIDFPNGNINYGLAHGMLGPLIFLSKAYSKGYISDDDFKYIEKLIDLYTNNRIERNGSFKWSSQQSFEEYVNDVNSDIYRIDRASWCYGYIGVTFGMLNVSRLIENKNLELDYLNNLKSILNQDFKDFNLDNAIICHGYAGLFHMLWLAQKLYKINSNEFNDLFNKCLYKLISCFSPSSKYGFISKDYAYIGDDKPILVENESLDLLEGTTGIILALTNLVSEDNSLAYHLMLN